MIDFAQIIRDHTAIPEDPFDRHNDYFECTKCHGRIKGRDRAEKHLNEKINERLAELLGRVKERIDYNAADFGTSTDSYIRTDYAKNIIDQLIKGIWL